MEKKNLENILDEFVKDVGYMADYDFYGIEDRELSDNVEKAYQECLSRGVPKNIMDDILDAADYTDMEDGGVSRKYLAERIATLKAEALKFA